MTFLSYYTNEQNSSRASHSNASRKNAK